MFTTPSKKKSKAILEAIMLWNKSSNSYGQYASNLKDAGWVLSNSCGGSFKQCYFKNNIAVKFPHYACDSAENEIDREYEQWTKAPAKFRKYLTNIYCKLDHVLIQDKVSYTCSEYRSNKPDATCIVGSLLSEFSIADYIHNHGHSIRGNVKFFDWVYNRTYDHLSDSKKGLYA